MYKTQLLHGTTNASQHYNDSVKYVLYTWIWRIWTTQTRYNCCIRILTLLLSEFGMTLNFACLNFIKCRLIIQTTFQDGSVAAESHFLENYVKTLCWNLTNLHHTCRENRKTKNCHWLKLVHSRYWHWLSLKFLNIYFSAPLST